VGEPFLAIFNVFSIVALLTARALDRRGHERVAFWLAIGEISAHAVVATIVLGLGSGFEFELLFVTLVSVYVPFLSLWSRGALSLAAGASLLGLIAVMGLVGPLRPVSAHLTLAFLLVNVAIVIGGMGAALVQLASVVHRAESALAEAYTRSESLLLNVLPAPIVARLKERPGLVADRYAEATIMFADIVGFTPMSARVPPDRLVLLLDDVNRTFDELIDGLGLEKIKTIGDAYMVAGGVPTPREDHAEAVAELALAMHDAVTAFLDDEGNPLRLRIGIASGPVVAGVIGQRKFSYDLWGDTVNTAARMESHGVPGATHVTPDTFERLKDRYPFTSRGPIEIKGKGLMHTYLLDGPPTTSH
jgi:adenylate cyclase